MAGYGKQGRCCHRSGLGFGVLGVRRLGSERSEHRTDRPTDNRQRKKTEEQTLAVDGQRPCKNVLKSACTSGIYGVCVVITNSLVRVLYSICRYGTTSHIMQLTFGCRKAAGRHNFMGRQIAIKMSPMSLMNPALHEQNHQSTMRADPLPYLSGIMGN